MATPPQPGRPRRPATGDPVPSTPIHETAAAADGSTAVPAGRDATGDLILCPGARPLPDYELVRRLGQGGFGEVWLAQAPGGFQVALKFIRLGGTAGRVELRSLEVIKGIRHAHLLSTFGAWQHRDFLIVAMELGERTLLERFREARGMGLPGIPAEELLEYLREAAKGIDFLNEPRHPGPRGEPVGIQHKDIKPQNLLLVGGSVKVADFGLAKILEDTATTVSGSMTPGYAAPELFGGQATRWSDQYALAVTYCQLRGGRMPFEGNPVAVMAGHLTGTPDLGMLPESERPVVARALAKKPEERWPTCRAFATALAAAADRAQDGTTEPEAYAEPTQATERMPSQVKRGRPWAVLAGLSLIALLAAAVGWVVLNGKLPRPGDPGPAVADLASNPSPAAGKPERQGDVNPVQVEPAPARPAPAALVLRPLGDVNLEPGKSAILEVRVERRNGAGLVRLQIEGLPQKVEAKPITLDAEESVARVELRAAEDAEEASQPAQVRATLGDVRADQTVRVTVRATPTLTLSGVADVTVEANQLWALGVRVQRRNWSGPVELWLEQLPDGVRSYRTVLPAERNEAIVELWTTASAVPERTVRLRAEGGLLRAEQSFRLTVPAEPRPAADRLAEADEAVRQRPRDPVAYLNRGHTYAAQRKQNEAIAEYDQAIALDPKCAVAFRARGRACSVKRDYDRAIADCTQAIELDPKYVWAYNNRGLACASKRQYDQAIADCDKAIELDDKFVPGYVNRARAYHAKRNDDAALADLETALRLEPEHASAHAQRGNLYLNRKDYARAIADCTRAIQLNGKDAYAYNIRGLANQATKEFDAALADLGRAVEISPDYAAAYYNRGRVLCDKKQYNDALGDFSKAIDLTPSDAKLYDWRGWTYAARGNYDQAITDYNKAIDLDPKFAWCYKNRGLAYANKRDYDQAIQDYTEALRLDPKFVLAHHNRGLAYAARRDYAGAISNYTSALELDSRYLPSYYGRAWAYRSTTQYEQALADYGKILEIDPKAELAHQLRAQVYTLQRKYNDAIADYTAILEVQPRHAGAHHHRGLAYSNKGDYERAIADYDEAIRLVPRYRDAYNDRGVAYALQKDYDRAAEDYTKAIDIDPRYVLAYNNRAIAYEKLGRSEAAKADREKAANLAPPAKAAPESAPSLPRPAAPAGRKGR
jgi:tetratricopeptide (TPR) repeat protein